MDRTRGALLSIGLCLCVAIAVFVACTSWDLTSRDDPPEQSQSPADILTVVTTDHLHTIQPLPLSLPAEPHGPRIAIIIDDIGYSRRYGEIAVYLPAPITLAVLPHSPNSRELANLGHQQGKDILVHVPMSDVGNIASDPGLLHTGMDKAQFMKTLSENLQAVPHAIGLNNHRGSALTQDATRMQWLMSRLAEENLFFIDSRTTAASVALTSAQSAAIATRKRDVFLDNERTQTNLAHQFERLLTLAKKKGSAIAIGHPYPETLEFLQSILPNLDKQGVELVSVSQLLLDDAIASMPPPTLGQSEETLKTSEMD